MLVYSTFLQNMYGVIMFGKHTDSAKIYFESVVIKTCIKICAV